MSSSEKKFWLKNGDLYYLTRMVSDYDYWILSKPGYGSFGNSKDIEDLIAFRLRSVRGRTLIAGANAKEICTVQVSASAGAVYLKDQNKSSCSVVRSTWQHQPRVYGPTSI